MALYDSPRSPSLSASSTSTPPSTAPEVDCSLDQIKPIHAGYGSDYSRWRPNYHLMPASGWMNDPCAPGYDSRTGNYTVSFQSNPNGPDWGDICWGTAISKDMCNWSVLEKPTLRRDTPYDSEGVFTGCLIPSTSEADSVITVAYTSVSSLPIHHTLPHTRGSESLSLAQSLDSGNTWTKLKANPVLPCEPAVLDVTGWRDPFVARWSRMADILRLDGEKTMFGIVSGGLRNLTPTTFVYAIDTDDLTNWRYIGPLIDVGMNKRLSRWSGDLGRNWEVTNFMPLKDEYSSSIMRDFLVMGTEGCLPVTTDSASMSSGLARPERGQLWMSGTLQRTGSSTNPVEMTYDFGGHLDHGCLYAANSFYDPQSQKQVVWGWVTEDDLCDNLRHKQGWSGMLSLPRELRMQTIQHVVFASASELEKLTSFETEDDEYGTVTLRTLGSQPLYRVQRALREGPGVRPSILQDLKLDQCGTNARFRPIDLRTQQWELQCSIRLSKYCAAAGLSICHSADFSKATTLLFRPSTETFTVTRPSFSRLDSDELINSSSESAPHTLFTTRDPVSGQQQTETLDLHIWRDNSVLEIFVNGRTAITTRIYAGDETHGIRFVAEDSPGLGDVSELLHATLFDGIGVS